MLVGLALGGCTSSGTPPGARVAASQAPPYTYWAPEGSVIVNHPTEAGIWIARLPDGGDTYYFGNTCGAAERQGWVGTARETLPTPRATGPVRIITAEMVVTADLNLHRLNVEFDEAGRVRRVYCS